MSNLWDRPPLTSNGDAEESVTYEYVGRVLSEWESLEFELSRLYRFFVGGTDEIEHLREYGAGRIFRDRAKLLADKAKPYFIQRCDQQREGDLDELIAAAIGHADRRNDIAHGIVFRISGLTLFRQRIRYDRLHRDHYAVVPTLYALRFHTPDGLPEYAYASTEMKRIASRILNLRKQVEKFRLDGQ